MLKSGYLSERCKETLPKSRQGHRYRLSATGPFRERHCPDVNLESVKSTLGLGNLCKHQHEAIESSSGQCNRSLPDNQSQGRCTNDLDTQTHCSTTITAIDRKSNLHCLRDDTRSLQACGSSRRSAARRLVRMCAHMASSSADMTGKVHRQ